MRENKMFVNVVQCHFILIVILMNILWNSISETIYEDDYYTYSNLLHLTLNCTETHFAITKEELRKEMARYYELSHTMTGMGDVIYCCSV